MPQKLIYIDKLGDIPFYKRKAAKNIKIKISGSDVRVSLPTWVPYLTAAKYLTNRADWVLQNRSDHSVFYSGCLIGKTTRIELVAHDSERFNAKQIDNTLRIKYPSNLAVSSKTVQAKILNYAIKALLRESEDLIIPLVRRLEKESGLKVNTIEIKNLKSRWGSCSNKNDLTFSLYLIQLPWECINYVIYHELAHTIHLDHSLRFWSQLGEFVPNFKEVRQKMKQYSPHVILQP